MEFRTTIRIGSFLHEMISFHDTIDWFGHTSSYSLKEILPIHKELFITLFLWVMNEWNDSIILYY